MNTKKCSRCGATPRDVEHAEDLVESCPFKDDGCILEHRLDTSVDYMKQVTGAGP